MPNGDSTANVGDLVEMESYIHLILRVSGEIDKLDLERGEISRKKMMLFREPEHTLWRPKRTLVTWSSILI